MNAPTDSVAPGTGETSSDVLWPGGPHYFDLTGSEGGVAWIRYRVWSADWHTRTLQTLGGPQGSFDRQVGIEMAIDGALNSLSGAFDAAVAKLIEAMEEHRGIDAEERLPLYRCGWNVCRERLIGLDAPSDSITDLVLIVEEGLEGEKTLDPSGWLARLRRLRNRVAHQDALARFHNIGDADDATGLSIGGRSVNAFSYLARMCDQVHALTERMIGVAFEIDPRHPTTTSHRRDWGDDQT